jgi:hypothetical protein
MRTDTCTYACNVDAAVTVIAAVAVDERTDEEKLLRGLAKMRELDMKLACKASHFTTNHSLIHTCMIAHHIAYMLTSTDVTTRQHQQVQQHVRCSITERS